MICILRLPLNVQVDRVNLLSQFLFGVIIKDVD